MEMIRSTPELERERIVREARNCFLRYGWRSVSLDDLAGRIVMSKKKVYTYFESKEDLIRQIIANDLEQLRTKVSYLLATRRNPIEQFLSVVTVFIGHWEFSDGKIVNDLHKYHPGIWSGAEQAKKDLIAYFIDFNSAAGVAAQLYLRDIDFHFLYRFLFDSVLLTDYPEATKDELSRHFLRGLLTETGMHNYQSRGPVR